MVKASSLTYKTRIHMKVRGKKVLLMAMAKKLSGQIPIKGSFAMAKNMAWVSLVMVMEATLRGCFKITLFKGRANFITRIIIGKVLGKMVIWREKVDN